MGQKYERMPLQYIDESYMSKVYYKASFKFWDYKNRIDEELRTHSIVKTVGLVAKKRWYANYLKRLGVMYYFINYYDNGNRFKRAF